MSLWNTTPDDQSSANVNLPSAKADPWLLRAIVSAVLMAALLVLLYFIGEIVKERQDRARGVADEIARTWGGRQTIAGPVLTVIVPENADHGEKGRSYMTIMPDRLAVKIVAKPQERKRGLFSVSVYDSEIEISGSFVVPAQLFVDGQAIEASRVNLQLFVSDARNLRFNSDSTIGGANITAQPGDGGPLGPASAYWTLTRLVEFGPDKPITFTIRLSMQGSQSLSMLPLGRLTEASIAADWHSPGFIGAYLPGERQVNDDSFTASWRISEFGRGFKPYIAGGLSNNQTETLRQSGFGVEFVQPLTAYRESERAVKYGILFLALSFAVYFLFEMATGQSIHVVQYAVMGLALCLFYLLLLSLAEPLGFGAAYLLSAMAITAQTGIYSWAVMRMRRHAIAFVGSVAGLYGFLYVLLGLESYALLTGSLALFLVLSALMVMTRNLNRRAPAPVRG